MLSALALSLWIASLFCDLLYLGGAEAAIWAPLALYTLVGGFVAALAAATPQLRKVRGLAHIPLEVLVLALYALNLSLRLGDSPNTALAIAHTSSHCRAGLGAAQRSASRASEACFWRRVLPCPSASPGGRSPQARSFSPRRVR